MPRVQELVTDGGWEEVDEGGCEGSSGSESDSSDDRHDNLLSTIAALKGKDRKRRAGLRSEATPTVSEYHFPQQEGAGAQVSVRELLTGLEGGRGLSHLRKRLTTGTKGGGVLEPPLPRPQADRIQRTVAYHEASENVSKWIPIVKRNREAEHLSFPLQEERPPLPSLTTKVESFKPVTELEREIAAVLESSENVKEAEGEGEGLSEAERKALLRMSLEEARERRRELQRSRALMSYYEQKAHRTGKIKSKKYHRMLRRRREAAGARRDGVGEGEGEEDKMETADRIRAKERMTLKHGSMARWARQQQARGHRDKATQQALAEHHQRRKGLKQRTVAGEESESESQYSESASSEDESSLPQHTSTTHSNTNPWLSASGGGGRKRPQSNVSGREEVLMLDPQPGISALATISPSHGGGGVSSGVGKPGDFVRPPSDFEPEEDPGESDSEPRGRGDGRGHAVAEGIKKAVKTGVIGGGQISAVEGKRENRERRKKKKTSKNLDEIVKESSIADEPPSPDTEAPLSKAAAKIDAVFNSPVGVGSRSHDIDPTSFMLVEEGGVALGGASQQLLNIQAAFAGEDVVGEFQREKAEEEVKSRPKEVDLTLPGWGVWGGEGVKPSKKRRKVVKPAEPEKPRKDNSLKHVIINESHDRKAAKHQVNSLPWPYTTTEQFEKTLSAPVGRQWTSEASFRQLIQPAVRTAVGSVIEPLKMTEDVHDFLKRTEKKGRGKRREGRREGRREKQEQSTDNT